MMRLAAGLGLGFVLAVVIAAAGIRFGIGVGWLRPVHRATASLEVLVMLWLLWMAWRRQAHRPSVWLAAALTLILSIVGIVGGQEPPPAIATVNLLGGLLLAATFAWLLGTSGKSGSDPRRENRGRTPIFLLLSMLAVQVCLGAVISINDAPIIPLHGMLAVALTALLVWLGKDRPALLALVLAAPLAGFTTLHYESSAPAAFAHAIAAAALVAGAAYAFARRA